MFTRKFMQELFDEIIKDHTFNGAAALAFYSMLAIFPAAIFLLTLLPYLPIPTLDETILRVLRDGMPDSAVELFSRTVQEVLEDRHGGLLTFGAAFALWTASSGIHATMRQLNISYGLTDERSFLRTRAIAIALTFGFSGLIIIGFALIVGGEHAEAWLSRRFDISATVLTSAGILRWVIVVFVLFIAVAAIYNYGPNLKQKFQFITPGALFAVPMLILTTLGFKFYVENFANYNATYGGIGAVIVWMLWLYFTGIVILVGSEINALVLKHRIAN